MPARALAQTEAAGKVSFARVKKRFCLSNVEITLFVSSSASLTIFACAPLNPPVSSSKRVAAVTYGKFAQK